MIIDVFEPFAERPQRLAAVIGDANQHVHYVDPVAVFRFDDEVSVVLSLLVELVAPLPGRPLVGGAEDAALLVGGFDGGVDDIWVRGG